MARRNLVGRAALGFATLGLVLLTAGIAVADTHVPTTTSQDLNLSIDGFRFDTTSVTALGYVHVSDGSVEIRSITASWDGDAPEPVKAGADGVSLRLSHATMAKTGRLVLVATTSDGTTATEERAWDEADWGVVRTTTDQRMSLTLETRDEKDGSTTGFGRAAVSQGPVSITSVSVSLSGSDPIKADLAENGDYTATKQLDPGQDGDTWASATASDGTKAWAMVPKASSSITGGGGTDPATKPPTTELPNTGPSGPRTLGPIGLAMVLIGSVLVWRSRRTRAV